MECRYDDFWFDWPSAFQFDLIIIRFQHGHVAHLTMMMSRSRVVFSSLARVASSRLAPSRIIPPTQTFLRAAFSSEPIVAGVGKGKTSTGYVGLAVEHDWYNVILEKFQALLDKMEASDMPATAQYRIDVTKWCNYVIQQAHENPENPEAVEDAVRMGQVEELIEMAEDEMVALDTYLRTRMWELVDTPEIDFEPDPMKDPFAEGSDSQTAEKLREGMEKMKEQKKE